MFFFSMWVFFHEHSRITGLEGKGEGVSLTPHYHFDPLHRHLDISRAITAESSPLHIASSRTRTGFPSALFRETKKLAGDARNDSSLAPATIPKVQPKHVNINNSDNRQQTLAGLATTHHTILTVYLLKLVTHSVENANVESSNENMDLESSRGIESPSLHDINNEHASKVHLFRERDDTKS